MCLATLIAIIAFNIGGILAPNNIIVTRSVHRSDIIKELRSASITSCFMKCSERSNCKGVGYVDDPSTLTNDRCFLLKDFKVKDEEEKEEKDIIDMFVVMVVSLQHFFSYLNYTVAADII